MAGSTKRTVCVIGGGAAGLCAVKHLALNPNFAVQVYEQTGNIGGTWVYKEETGFDENGLPIHSSMYRDLRTNLPVKIMNFPDYPRMNAEEPCCVTHREIRTYLESYAEHFDLLKYIQLNTRVESVRLKSNSAQGEEQWIVRIKKLKTEEVAELTFDFVMVCNGHYFDPYVPNVPGVQTFPGTVMHSHSYRKPEDFSNKTVLILGAGSSGIDIGIDLANHVTRVFLSHNNERVNSTLPSNMEQVMGVERIEGENIILKDKRSVTADVLIFCTGYRYSFPFLHESCAIHVDDNYITPLYKHLINIEHPSMCIVGVPTIVVPFSIFHVQVQYFRALLEGRVKLPSKSDMLEDSKLKAEKKRHAHKLMDKQWDYNDSLADAGGFERLPKFYRRGYEVWSTHRKLNRLNYKEAKFLISEDGENVQLVIPN